MKFLPELKKDKKAKKKKKTHQWDPKFQQLLAGVFSSFLGTGTCVEVTGMSENMQLFAKMWCQRWQLTPVKRNMATWTGGNVQLFCFHGRWWGWGGCCSKTCAAPVKSTALQKSSHTRDRKDDSSAATVRASVRAFEGEKESPPEGLSYGAGEIHQGQAEVGKMIPLLCEQRMA